MDISYNWLQDFISEDLPAPVTVAKVLTRGAYEVESITSAGEDTIFDIDVLPNRASDSLSHEGVARELAVLSELSFSSVKPEPNTDESIRSDEVVQLSVGTDACRRAMKRIAVDVEVGESPDWLKDRLAILGQKSINNVVDITNYLMLELGQPVHAFDYDKLAGKKVKEVLVRPAKSGQEITTLDGETYELTEDMLVIADEEKPLDIAGLKGGIDSGIDEDTTRVLLSACSFDPATIRKTSQKLNLRTDASKRFENDVPPAGVARAMDRFSELLADIAGARVADDVLDVYPRPAQLYKVGVQPNQVNSLLGTDISNTEIIDILTRLGCDVEARTPRDYVIDKAEELEGVPYTYGASVLRDAPQTFDCSSFISWLFVQAGVRMPRMTGDQYVFAEEITEDELTPGDIIFSNTKKDEGGEIYYEGQEYMPGTEIPGGVDHCGLYLGAGKVIHVSRHNHNEEGGVEIELLEEANQFQNITKFGRVPDAEEPHLVATIPYWRTDLRRSADLIEEVGRIYGYDSIKAALPAVNEPVENTDVRRVICDTLVAAGFQEVKTYSLIESGEIKVTNPVAEDKAYLRSSLRANIQTVLEENSRHLPVLSADQLRIFEVGTVFTASEEVTEIAVAVAGNDQKRNESSLETAFASLENILGVKLSPTVDDGTGTVQIDESKLDIDSVPVPNDELFRAIDFKTPSPYPYVLRDIAVWTPSETKADAVQEIIQKSAGDLLVANNLFDTYEKEEKTSYAFKLVFQSREKTLSDKEVNEHMKSIEKALEENGGFLVR